MNFFLDSLIQNMTDNLSKAMNRTYTEETSNGNNSENVPLKLNVGDVITGEITDIRPQEIKIRTDNNQIVTAEMKEQFDLYIGQVLKFQVKDFDGSQILLRPMLEDSSQNAAIVKALREANIPVSSQMEAVVNALLAENMSIDKSTLQNIYKDMINFKDSNPDTIVNLYKFKIPVSEQSIQNLESYNSEKYPLLQKLSTIANGIPETLLSLASENKTEQCMDIIKSFLPAEVMERLSSFLGNKDAVQFDSISNWQSNNANNMENQIESFVKQLILGAENGNISNKNAENGNQSVALNEADNGKIIANNQDANTASGTRQAEQPPNAESGLKSRKSAVLSQAMSEEAGLLQTADSKSSGRSANMQNGINANQPYAENDKETIIRMNGGQETAAAETDAQQPAASMSKEQDVNIQKELLDKADARKILLALLSRNDFKEFIKNEILSRVLISPKELEEENGVSSYFKRLDKQIQEMMSAIKNDTETGAQLSKQFTETRESIDFLNQLNQTATYVQLPLKLSSQNQNADLYVYTDKRALKNRQNQVTAFLHLNLNYLGDLDVYISMQNRDLKVNFYIKDESNISFIKQNMDKLTTELNQIGYSINAGVFPKLQEMPVIDRIKQEEQEKIEQREEKKEEKPAKRYSFDVRM